MDHRSASGFRQGCRWNLRSLPRILSIRNDTMLNFRLNSLKAGTGSKISHNFMESRNGPEGILSPLEMRGHWDVGIPAHTPCRADTNSCRISPIESLHTAALLLSLQQSLSKIHAAACEIGVVFLWPADFTTVKLRFRNSFTAEQFRSGRGMT